MAGKRITIEEARKLARKAGWNLSEDFHSQSSGSMVSDLLAIATLKGYRKPKNANGSKARYFFAYLQRGMKKGLSGTKKRGSRAGNRRPKPKYEVGEIVMFKFRQSSQKYKITMRDYRADEKQYVYKVNNKWWSDKYLGKRKSRAKK
ncbi:MAG: hypothetical protein AAF998_23360 [Bacteroidota bacterium]